MYSFLWQKLRGNLALKILQLFVLGAVALALLYFYVFPWLDVFVFPETETEI